MILRSKHLDFEVKLIVVTKTTITYYSDRSLEFYNFIFDHKWTSDARLCIVAHAVIYI